MTRNLLAALAVATITAVPASARPVNWTDWQTSSGNNGPVTVTGEMSIGDLPVTVTSPSP